MVCGKEHGIKKQMIRKPVRDLHSESSVPPRFCDVIIDSGRIFLELKGTHNGRPAISRIRWEDVVLQVEALKSTAEPSRDQELPQ